MLGTLAWRNTQLLLLSLVGSEGAWSKYLLCSVINTIAEWSPGYYESTKNGVSLCLRKYGKASRRRGHLGGAPQACETENIEKE